MNIPFINLTVDTLLALAMCIAGVWIFLKNWNKWGLLIILVTLFWLWKLYIRFY